MPCKPSMAFASAVSIGLHRAPFSLSTHASATTPLPTCCPPRAPPSATAGTPISVAPIPRVWGPDSDPPKNSPPLQDSPLARGDSHFVDGQAVLAEAVLDAANVSAGRLGSAAVKAYYRAGPRRKVYFGANARAAIVTSGGIAPGLATVVREVVMTLCVEYGLGFVFGVPFGWRGFYERSWERLTPGVVERFHLRGGTPLGSSRGGFDVVKIVDAIETRGLDMVFIVGGDGTMMGTQKICDEVRRRALKIAVVHIPKTVDKDIALLTTTFGFDTAVESAQTAIKAADVEAASFPDCVAIVKLMGRNSGFIASYATLSSRDVDVCLVPEVPFTLSGPGGVLEHIEKVLDRKGKCVVVVAEGAGASIASATVPARNIGLLLLDAVKEYFAERADFTSKYIDPTYMVRAGPPIASDNILCTLLSHAAAHGAMAGMTGCVFGPVQNHNVCIPLTEVAGRTETLDPSGRVWQRVISSTQQPAVWGEADSAAEGHGVYDLEVKNAATEGSSMSSLSSST